MIVSLFFVLIFEFTARIFSSEEKLRSHIGQLEKELEQCRERIANLETILEEKERLIHDYENRLIVSERKHALELRTETDKQRQLKAELEQRSTLIAQLTHQLHREKQQSQTRLRLGQLLLPDKPRKLKNPDESPKSQPLDKRLINRSTSLSNRASPDHDFTKVLLVGRRPPTPPQQLRPLSSKAIDPMNDEQVFSKRQRQLLHNHGEHAESSQNMSPRSMKVATVLPPIVSRKMPLKPLTTTNTKFQQEGEV